MASVQVVETSVNTNNSPSQDYTTNPDDHSNHNREMVGRTDGSMQDGWMDYMDGHGWLDGWMQAG